MFVKNINTVIQAINETLHERKVLKLYKIKAFYLYILTKYIFY